METLLTCVWLPVWFLQSMLIKTLGGFLFLSLGGTPEVSMQSSFVIGLLYLLIFGLLFVNIFPSFESCQLKVQTPARCLCRCENTDLHVCAMSLRDPLTCSALQL